MEISVDYGTFIFPFPCAVLCRSVMSDSFPPHRLWPARLLCPWRFSRQEYWSGLLCPPQGDLPNPGIEPRSPALWADSLHSEPPGKPKYTGVGSLYILQGIFSTQNSKRGLLHCRWILYQPSYQGSPTSFLLIHSFHTFCNVSLITRKKSSKKCEV